MSVGSCSVTFRLQFSLLRNLYDGKCFGQTHVLSPSRAMAGGDHAPEGKSAMACACDSTHGSSPLSVWLS